MHEFVGTVGDKHSHTRSHHEKEERGSSEPNDTRMSCFPGVDSTCVRRTSSRSTLTNNQTDGRREKRPEGPSRGGPRRTAGANTSGPPCLGLRSPYLQGRRGLGSHEREQSHDDTLASKVETRINSVLR